MREVTGQPTVRTPNRKVKRFKILFYVYLASVIALLLLYSLSGELSYITAGIGVRISITVCFFVAMFYFRHAVWYWVFKINLFLITISYFIGSGREFAEYLYYFRYSENTLETALLVLMFTLSYVIPIITLVWMIILLETSSVANYLKNKPMGDSADKPFNPFKFDREVLEWLGMAKADWLSYLAIGLALASFFVAEIIKVVSLFLIALLACVYAIIIGAKEDASFSWFTNLMKKYSYHAILLLVAGLMFYRLFWYTPA
jgi:hypothetical protein